MPAVKAALAAADGSALRTSLLDVGTATVDVEGEPLVLDLEDIEVTVQAKEGYAAAGDQSAVVVLSTELTPELVNEGIYREFLSRVQALRKELGLEYTQRIRLAVGCPDSVESIITDRRDHFLKETLCVELVDTLDGATSEFQIDGEPVTITLTKA